MGLIKNQYVFYYPYHEKEMVLEKDLAFQIHKVLRLKEGKKILLLDGKGKHSTYVLQKISPLKVEVSKVQEKFSPPSSPLILALALLKSDKTEWVLQKGTELGATQFLIFEGENSIAKIKGTEKKLVRWQKIIQEAFEQSCGAYLPSIQTCPNLLKVLDAYQGFWLAGDADSSQKLRDYQDKLSQGCGVLIGPEGGFSLAEFDFFQKQGVQFFKIASQILRAETAALASLAQIGAFLS